MKYVLGVHDGHDAAAAIIVDGKIVADVAEERFTRVKNDSSFPLNAISYCLDMAGIGSEKLDAIAIPSRKMSADFAVFFELPPQKMKRKSITRKGKSLIAGVLGLDTVDEYQTVLPTYQPKLRLSPDCLIILVDHHRAHAGSAYYTSGLSDEVALIVSMDGIGDSVSLGIWKGGAGKLEQIKTWDGSASLGWFFSNCTEALGWRHGSDEWKTMGLAPYGKRRPGVLKGFYPEFKDGELIKPQEFEYSGIWFDHSTYHYHFEDASKLQQILGEVGREDFCAEAQQVFEEQLREIIPAWLKRLDTRHFCAAGGSFLNVKANQDLWYSGLLDSQWIYPNPGDAGLPVGAALCAYHEKYPDKLIEKLQDVYLGPEFSNDEILEVLQERGLKFELIDDPAAIAANCLADNKIIGWFQGRMESGPRALGNRSILMSPLRIENKDIINQCVKYREAFRPFCPSILGEKRDEYLEGARDENFMITSFLVTEEKRARIPAVVHVDFTARPQTVWRETNPRYYDLIKLFGDFTGEYVVLNTSFNVKGEPIVCNPREAIRCFYDTGIDVLILGNYMLTKQETPYRSM